MAKRDPVGEPDLLALLRDAAAAAAEAHFRAPVRLARCEGCSLGAGVGAEAGLRLESWLVRAERGEGVVTAFATEPQGAGRRMAGSGRFVFRPVGGGEGRPTG